MVASGTRQCEYSSLHIIITHKLITLFRRINEYILLKPAPAARFYPAKVLGRSSTYKVHVEWYKDNVYDQGSVTGTMRTVYTPHECAEAKFRDSFSTYTSVSIASLVLDGLNEYTYRRTLVQ